MKLMNRMLACAALALMAASCSPGAADAGTKAGSKAGSKAPAVAAANAVHPVSGLQVAPVTVISGNSRHVFKTEFARTSPEQAKGLMFRTSLGDDEAMIFLRNPPDRASFWMRNTVIPLDIIYIGVDRRILNIAANAVPYDETPLLSAGTTLAVFEINGGLAQKLGIKPGDKVEW